MRELHFTCENKFIIITSGPEVFQRVMQQMLMGVEDVDCFIIIDDIVYYIYSVG